MCLKSFLWVVATLCFSCCDATNDSTTNVLNKENLFLDEFWGNYYGEKYRYFSEAERIKSKKDARNMFYFGYDSYMKYAYPQDELNPIDCTGRGPDVLNP